MTVGLLIAGSVPAAALSIFGVQLSGQAIAGSEQTAGQQQAASGISDQAANFVNDIVWNTDANTCLTFANHEYEVCTAYIFNASMADLVPYYMYANTDNGSLSRLMTYRLGSRYTGQADDGIIRRVSQWPKGNNDVDVPQIKVLSVNASLATDTATLRTQETWLVRSEATGSTVYREDNAYHTVMLERVPSYLLHKWVVTDIE